MATSIAADSAAVCQRVVRYTQLSLGSGQRSTREPLPGSHRVFPKQTDAKAINSIQLIYCSGMSEMKQHMIIE